MCACLDMIVMESSLSNISGATVAADVTNYRTKQFGENTLTLEKKVEKNSAYMANMVLPEIVQSSRAYPLGPDCIITHTECTDPSLMTNMDLYWFISLEKGCVECKIKHDELSNSTTTTDPRCIITRKPRRFEAYCCTFCRSNFVTVVQALLHMKAFHRQKMKIFIQDQNVFHDIEKAMEVPPVPLPWYAAKKIFPPNTSQTRNSSDYEAFSIMSSAGDSTEQTITSENNPVTNLLQAIVKEYGKQVHTALFGKDFCDVKVQFEDKSVIIAQLPEMVSQESSILEANDDIKEKLEFRVERLKEEDIETCIVTVNKPALARHLIVSALKQGVSENSGETIATLDKTEEDKVDVQEENQKSVNEILPSKDISARSVEEHIPASQVKLDSRGRPSKTVRFMVGNPDSDEDDNSSAGEKSGWSEQEENRETELEHLSAESKKPKEDEGLQGVVKQLISTASNCNLIPVDPTSPVSTSSSVPMPNVREEILATAAMHARSLPKILSSPNLIMTTQSNSPLRKSAMHSSVTSVSGMSRAQSWAGKAGAADSSQKFTLSTYPRSTSPSFEHLSRADQRKFLTGGRAFTYAEKIKLMKMLNDQDSAITEKHIRGGLLAETSLNLTNTLSSSTTTVTSSMMTRSSSSSSSSMSSGDSAKLATSEQSTQPSQKASVMIGAKRKQNEWTAEGRKRRKSKYDVPEFMQTDLEDKTSLSSELKKLTSDSSASDDEKETSEMEQAEGDNPPTLLNVMRSAYPAFLASRGSLFSGPTSSHIPAGYSAAMLSSEYYGSGEWANAAMQTLRNLQSTIELQAAAAAVASSGSSLLSRKIDKARKEQADNEPAEKQQAKSVTDELENSVFDEGKSTDERDFLTAVEPTRSRSEETILALAKQITNEKGKLLVSQNPSRSLSPLSGEQVHAKLRNPKSNETEKVTKDPKAKLKKLETRSASDSNLKKRSVVPTVENSSAIAQKGDFLEFLQNLTEDSLLDDEDILLLKFHKKSSLTEDQSSNVDMPQIFQNSVETCMKVKYIEKISVCRVCGYQITLSDDSNSGLMKSHVMEHSLKELLQTGYNGRELV